MLGQSGGGLVAPVLVGLLGIDGALVAAGLAVTGGALLCVRWLTGGSGLDERQARRLAALGQAHLFMPLSAPVIERVAARATDLVAAPGDILIREGEAGDAFFVLASGAVEVTVGGTVVGQQRGAGAAFGEIALLRDVPRSATVRAIEPVVAVVIARVDFLDALTGQGRSRRLAERVADERWEAAH
jgi:CRP-like cAMP-binding protein